MVRERLRIETRQYHERLEKILAITETIKSKQSYTRLLEGFYGLYLPLERRLLKHSEEWNVLGFDLAPRLKTNRIVQDLLTLGYTDQEIAKLPECSKLPELDNSQAAIGCLYVLEGSTLGGQILTRYFKENLGLSPETGCSYFSGYGSETRTMWIKLIEFLDRSAHDTPNVSKIIETACTTFSCFESWFSPVISR